MIQCLEMLIPNQGVPQKLRMALEAATRLLEILYFFDAIDDLSRRL